MSFSKRTGACALAVAIIGMAVQSGRAGTVSVNLNTYEGSGWQVERTLAGGPFTESDTTTGTVNVQNITSIPGGGAPAGVGNWITFPNDGSLPSNEQAQWVAWTKDAGIGYDKDVNGTTYTYSRTFTLTPPPSGGLGTFDLSGLFALDNYVSSVSLVGTGGTPPVVFPVVLQLLSSPIAPLAPTEAGYVYAISAEINNFLVPSPSTFVLTITGVNSYASGDPLDSRNPGPTGFIFSGSASSTTAGGGAGPSSPATAVPLPNAAGIGFGMLFGFGGLFAARKSVRRSGQMTLIS